MTRNIFRGLILVTLIFNFYNAFIGDIVPRYSLNSWGKFKSGPFLTVLFVWLILEIANYLSSHGTLPANLWGFAAMGLMLDSTSDYTLLFEKFRHYDSLMHFIVGGIIASFIIINALKHFFNVSSLPTIWLYALTVMLVNLAGVMYEILELIADKYFGASNITSRFDTTQDLIFNIAGSLTFILLHRLLAKSNFAITKSAVKNE